MKKLLSFLLFLTISSLGYGQSIKKGVLSCKSDNKPVSFAHIQNLSQEKGTISNYEGEFLLPINLGDTLVASSVGYEKTFFIVQKEWAESSTIHMQIQKDTVLLSPVTVFELPTESAFKQRILETEVQDTVFEVFGVPQIAKNNFNDQGAPSFKSAGTPFGAIYRSMSKREKEKRKMQEIISSRQDRNLIRQKFNRDYIHELTLLEGDQLTDFMVYCDFSDEFILKSTEYQLAEAVFEKLKEFKRSIKS